MEAENKKTEKLKRIYGVLPAAFLVIILAVLFGLFLRVDSEKERLLAEKKAMVRKERPPVNVVLQEVAPGPIRERISLPGMVEAWNDLQLLAEVSGMVVEVPVAEGDRVGKGDIIARLDSRDYKNTLRSISASHELALTNRNRLQKLFEQNIISRSELDNAEARLESLAAEKEIAARQLEKCLIIAPIAGLANTLPAQIGQYLSVGDPVARILTIDKLKVVVGIPESDVDAVRRLDSFEIAVDALDSRKIKASKYFLSVAPESMALLYRLEMAVGNADGRLLPGMFARVEIVKQQKNDALSIPLYAVISRDDKNYVYVEEEGLARLREVEAGILEGWRVEIVRGLAPGERVIVVGQRDVDEGQRLNIIRRISKPEEIAR